MNGLRGLTKIRTSVKIDHLACAEEKLGRLSPNSSDMRRTPWINCFGLQTTSTNDVALQ